MEEFLEPLYRETEEYHGKSG